MYTHTSAGSECPPGTVVHYTMLLALSTNDMHTYRYMYAHTVHAHVHTAQTQSCIHRQSLHVQTFTLVSSLTSYSRPLSHFTAKRKRGLAP